ncbi:MAG: hypothetical protein KZQ88_04845 [Candidatus Thiodiazotropha sp. (ex Dulcina madagascariensis)]|nr:hypothetical protein [Candidatus Thiodiazotropha sp. (ex Dulcina madagascariensis)]MCU7925412.1 hypothetical protein [Candidatus Thiodiazotropha sp. (ex Dulcina madagascariensis)]
MAQVTKHSDTHEVFNQPTPLEHYNAYASDLILQHYVYAFSGDWGDDALSEYGRLVGNELQTAGFDANHFNAIWEGSGNIQCLDVTRAIEKNPNVLEVFLMELDKATNYIERYDDELNAFKQSLMTKNNNEHILRRQVEKMALLWQASTLIQFSDEKIAGAFVSSRISQDHGYMYGTLPEHIAFRDIMDRAKPKV